jgi:hypothetical protein
MQAVAAEMNLSETAFLHRDGPGYALRWFTPVAEVELCGHATLASAHALWETGREPEGAPIAFAIALRQTGVINFWPYVFGAGAISWLAFFRSGMHPALALVPHDLGLLLARHDFLTGSVEPLLHCRLTQCTRHSGMQLGQDILRSALRGPHRLPGRRRLSSLGWRRIWPMFRKRGGRKLVNAKG